MTKTVEIDLNFDVDDFSEEVREIVEEALAVGVRIAVQEFLKRIPADRVKTRQSLVAQVMGDEAYVGVLFPADSRYPKRGTITERIVTHAWRSMEQKVLDEIQDYIEQQLREVS